MIMLDKVRRMAPEFDIIHVHFDQFHFPVLSRHAHHTLTTLHGRQDLPDLQRLYAAFPQMPLVSISNAQRTSIPNANFAATIHHGLPLELFKLNLTPRGKYLSFLGRISPEKGVDRAIAIARAVNLPLKIAAKVDRLDRDYFHHQIAPLIDPPRVDFIGEIDETAKAALLRDSLAVLFPINWPEPFGLVMIEAMACGTPVIAFDRGAVREVVDDGVTGQVVNRVDEAVSALPQVLALDRAKVRRQFEKRFSAARMATDYLKVYRGLLRSTSQPSPHRLVPASA
jgi:glycosyltransferase involved in cell wall biosynthesis